MGKITEAERRKLYGGTPPAPAPTPAPRPPAPAPSPEVQKDWGTIVPSFTPPTPTITPSYPVAPAPPPQADLYPEVKRFLGGNEATRTAAWMVAPKYKPFYLQGGMPTVTTPQQTAYPRFSPGVTPSAQGWQEAMSTKAGMAAAESYRPLRGSPEAAYERLIGVGGHGTPTELRAGYGYGPSSAVFSGVPGETGLQAAKKAAWRVKQFMSGAFGEIILPAFITPAVANQLGISAEEMGGMGYFTDAYGNWRRIDIETATDTGGGTDVGTGGYGGGGGGYYYPSYSDYGGGYGTARASFTGLINWRIGL